MSQLRLDKILCDLNYGSRSEVKQLIKKGFIEINSKKIINPDYKVDIEKDVISYNGESFSYKKFEYYMLNKPSGYVSASSDNTCKTVIDLITTSTRKDLFPVGRLDKDTEGLLLITNDGELAHNLLSPKKHIDKTYLAEINNSITEDDIATFNSGIDIGESTLTLPAKLEIINNGSVSHVKVTIHEGKFHQIKRMFHALGKEVIYLKRISMGNLFLDENLKLGEFKVLTLKEITDII